MGSRARPDTSSKRRGPGRAGTRYMGAEAAHPCKTWAPVAPRQRTQRPSPRLGPVPLVKPEAPKEPHLSRFDFPRQGCSICLRRFADPSREVEDAIHDEWKAHIAPSDAILGVEAAAREHSRAGQRLDKTVAAAKAAGASWADSLPTNVGPTSSNPGTPPTTRGFRAPWSGAECPSVIFRSRLQELLLWRLGRGCCWGPSVEGGHGDP